MTKKGYLLKIILILYLNNYPKLNKNYSKEKNIIIENGRNEMININIKNDKKNISEDNNENIKQNNIWKSFSINKNKNGRNLNLYNK